MNQKNSTLHNVQERILELVSASNGAAIEDETIAEKLKIEIEEIRFYLEELQAGGFVELFASKTFEGKSYLATGITPKGFMILKGKLKLDDNTKFKMASNIYNITTHGNVGVQQFGDESIANVTQSNHNHVNELLQLVNTLKNLIETLPEKNREAAQEVLSLIENEVVSPTERKPVIVKTGLLALWAVVKDFAVVANAATALADRFDIHLLG